MAQAPAGAVLLQPRSEPRPLAEVARTAVGVEALRRLVDRGLATLSAFTPSDALHVLGRQHDWSVEAARLGAFLKALHTPAPIDAPSNPFRGVPLRQRAATITARMQRLATSSPLITTEVRRVWEKAEFDQHAEALRKLWP